MLKERKGGGGGGIILIVKKGSRAAEQRGSPAREGLRAAILLCNSLNGHLGEWHQNGRA